MKDRVENVNLQREAKRTLSAGFSLPRLLSNSSKQKNENFTLPKKYSLRAKNHEQKFTLKAWKE